VAYETILYDVGGPIGGESKELSRAFAQRRKPHASKFGK